MEKRVNARSFPDGKQVWVDAKTWTGPTLIRALMPTGIIDELRNKYSRFRTRHDVGYLLSRERQRELENNLRKDGGVVRWGDSVDISGDREG